MNRGPNKGSTGISVANPGTYTAGEWEFYPLAKVLSYPSGYASFDATANYLFTKIGSLVLCQIYGNGTGNQTYVRIPLPYAPIPGMVVRFINAKAAAGTWLSAYSEITDGSPHLSCYRTIAGDTWAGAGGVTPYLNFFYFTNE